MKNGNGKKPIRERVLEAIKSGQVKMRPKWHFILKTALAAIGGIILLLAILYFTSLIIFMMRRTTGIWFVQIFGPHEWFDFLLSLPWLLIIFALLFVIILEILVERYSFAYRRPLLYSAIGIVILAVIGGFLVAGTSLHDRLFKYTEGNRPPPPFMPFASPLYHGFGQPHPRNIHIGEIIEIVKDGFVIKNQLGEILTIIISPQTRLPLNKNLSKGDIIAVFGERKNNNILAFGIKDIDK